MKNVVSTLATLVLLTLATATAAFGQTAPPKEGAVIVGTFQARFGNAKSEPNLAGSVSEAGGTISVTGWLVEGGETVYTLDVNTAEFQMPCGWAQNVDMASLVDMMAQGAIRTGLELGYSHIGPDCENNIVDVYYPTCITRSTGAGCPTLTAAAGSDYSINGYRVCGEIFNPMITLVYVIRGQSICGDGLTDTKSLDSTSGTKKWNKTLKNLVDDLGLVATR